ncbi:uncharacterized protein LOC133919918 [Phragmites australis]|uniref:uncharacterized protein LOC133919918 n=1 Tax=Phragmites australis TaxID=29695 RepID=UPI002D77CC38|nr:uncharacterized protein LOC133919918 [Phragmites australis]
MPKCSLYVIFLRSDTMCDIDFYFFHLKHQFYVQVSCFSVYIHCCPFRPLSILLPLWDHEHTTQCCCWNISAFFIGSSYSCRPGLQPTVCSCLSWDAGAIDHLFSVKVRRRVWISRLSLNPGTRLPNHGRQLAQCKCWTSFQARSPNWTCFVARPSLLGQWLILQSLLFHQRQPCFNLRVGTFDRRFGICNAGAEERCSYLSVRAHRVAQTRSECACHKSSSTTERFQPVVVTLPLPAPLPACLPQSL